MIFRTLPLSLAIGLTLSAAASASTNEHGLDPRNFDTSVPACTDFYKHANGHWLEMNPVPAAYTIWGTFNELEERNEAILKSILDDSGKTKAAPGTNAQKIADYYASAMDEAAIEKAGIKPLQPDLDRVAKLKTNADVVKALREWHARGINVMFGFGSRPDLKNSSMVIGYATQGGLGLPERDYYFRDDEDSKALRDKYVAHIARTLVLTGVAEKDAGKQAAEVMALEARLAKASLKRVELREPSASYHIMTIAQANEKTPHFDWAAYFAANGVKIESFSLAHPDFFAELDKMLADVPTAQWQAYLRWHLARNASPYLSKAFVDEDFAFYQATLRGAKEIKPRYKRVVESIDDNLGEAMGELFVARAFPPESKAKALDLINNLRTALKAHLEKLPWMGEETRKQALVKLSTFTPKIGYPDKWRDYSKLTITRGAYLDNVLASIAFENRRDLDKIGKPVDKLEWHMTPQRVNAYYSALQNEIVFPAAILQPPFFDAKADNALNYGGIGAVIGHELLHGFDDQGSKFDAEGNLKSWWTDDDRRKFDDRTAKLGAQADAFVAIGNLHVNGKLTMGENIGDLGGLTIAYDAFKIAQKDAPNTEIDGLTPDQRFFYSWAQIWRRSYRDEALKLQVNTDPHAPGPFRVNGPFSNLEGFRKAFSCKSGDPMVNEGEKQVVIW